MRKNNLMAKRLEVPLLTTFKATLTATGPNGILDLIRLSITTKLVHLHTRNAGHLVQHIFQGWLATSGRAQRRMSPRVGESPVRLRAGDNEAFEDIRLFVF